MMDREPCAIWGLQRRRRRSAQNNSKAQISCEMPFLMYIRKELFETQHCGGSFRLPASWWQRS